MSTEGLGGNTTTNEQTPPLENQQTPPEFSGPDFAKDWGIDPELANDPSLKVFKTPADLAKSYVHAQRNMGRDKVILPNKNSTKEEWDQFYSKTGVPLEEQKYHESLQLPKENVLGEEFGKGFLKMAHENRVAPTQAQKMFEFFDSQVKTNAEKIATQQAEARQAQLDALANEWGTDAYNVKVKKAELFLKENASPEFLEYLGKTGLGKDVNVVKAFTAMAEKFMGEKKLPDGDPTHGMTKADLDREINNVMGNMNDPYYNASHPDHMRRVNEVASWRKKLEK